VWTPQEKEIASVLQLTGPKRYAYWVKKVADEELVWSLWQESGWVLAADNEGRQLVPVWPHEKYAELCAHDSWAGCVPRPIELNVWMERWIPGVEREGTLVAVFSTPDCSGVVVEPSRLDADLREELTNYE